MVRPPPNVHRGAALRNWMGEQRTLGDSAGRRVIRWVTKGHALGTERRDHQVVRAPVARATARCLPSDRCHHVAERKARLGLAGGKPLQQARPVTRVQSGGAKSGAWFGGAVVALSH